MSAHAHPLCGLQLAAQAGHRLDLQSIVREEWMAGCVQAQRWRYGQLAACIDGALALH